MKGILGVITTSLCLFAAACAGTAPTGTAPTALSSLVSAKESVGATEAQGGSELLPFKGTYEGLETIVTAPSHHHLDATGNLTHLGLFTVTADWTIGAGGGTGTARWIAANGDELSTSFRRHGVATPPIITFTETHTITGGTGRFANAAGSFTVVQTRGLVMPYNNTATIDGSISWGR
jgi:hypothetical protein